MCRTPELAVEVTLQPLDLIGVDAAIIFSDILVIPEAMGMELTLDEGVGPRFPSPLRSSEDVARLRTVVPEDSLSYVLEALRLARREIDNRVPLIGFAGAPWTLAAYMVEGKGTKHFAIAKRLIFENPSIAHALLDTLATAVGDYLVAQAEAGAQVLQAVRFVGWRGCSGTVSRVCAALSRESGHSGEGEWRAVDRLCTWSGLGPDRNREGNRG